MAAVSITSKVLGRKIKKFCAIFLLKLYFGHLGRGYYPLCPSLATAIQAAGHIFVRLVDFLNYG